jgi:hypothetical protein
MHKTRTGRWQPDPLPKPDAPADPEPEPVHDVSYEMYLLHRYSHLICDLHPNCPWCAGCAVCLAAERGSPFDVLNGVTLR